MATPQQDRQSSRQAVLKTAKLIFQGSVLDCLLLDVSETGFRVQLGTMTPVPKQVTVQFSSGASFSAAQRWARGTEIGFVFTGPAQLGAADRGLAWDIAQAIRASSLSTSLRHLSDLRYFHDHELNRLADEVATAVQHLDAALLLLAQEKG